MSNKSNKTVYKLGAIALLLIVALIPLQIIVFFISPPPETIDGFLDLYQENPLLGMLSLDLLYIINNIFLIIPFIVLFIRLKKVSYPLSLASLVAIVISLSIYFNTNPSLEFLNLSKQYFDATSTYDQQLIIAACTSLLANYTGTGFFVYYMLGGVAILLVSLAMIYDNEFGKPIIVLGIISGVTMLVPSTVGMIGFVMSLLSLIPWIIFSILVAIKLLKIED